MKNIKWYVFLTACVIILAGWFNFSISSQLKHYHSAKLEIAKELSFKKRILDVEEYIPFFGSSDSKNERYKMLDKRGKLHYQKASMNAIFFAVTIFAYLFSTLFLFRKSNEKLKFGGLSIVVGAFCFLFLGLTSPLIEIQAFNQDLAIDFGVTTYDYKGLIYYLYLNESILKLIGDLFVGGNLFVASALFLFSVVFPLFKLISTMIIFLSPNPTVSKAYVDFLGKIGKWSMADVFVAAIFLSIFSFTNMDFAVETGSKTLLGLYFFLSFVVLSIVSGSVLKKYLKKAQTEIN